jgi:hypothetical protein
MEWMLDESMVAMRSMEGMEVKGERRLHKPGGQYFGGEH